MARRNIANRQDIAADALRQRRDLYALAIGLTVFHLAGGTIASDTSFGSILPVSLARPWVFEVAAWLGFFYFWIRFWLISEGKPFDDFKEDARWQAGDLPAMRELACSFVTGSHYQPEESSFAMLRQSNGLVPRMHVRQGTPMISLDALTANATRNGRGGMPMTCGPADNEVPSSDRRRFWWSWAKGWAYATFRERSFTDYTLPHLFALLAVGVGVFGWTRRLWPVLGL